MEQTTQSYWNEYYSARMEPSVPSQFAAFVLNEFRKSEQFVDIGCGDGRDALFFASFGKPVLGIDGSTEAVAFCSAVADERGLTSASFSTLDVSDAAACKAMADKYAGLWSDAVIYARFFLHAIDETSEDNFLKLAHALMGPDGRICIEFRTLRDQHQMKVTESHYRRFIDPVLFVQKAARLGLVSKYLAEGFGFAKYKQDDAHVARVVLSR